MSANFNIEFNSNNTGFTFTDLTDYSGLGTVEKTDLLVIYPPITGVDEITLNLFDENINNLGDPFTFLVSEQENLEDLYDGVYSFNFVINDDQGIISESTKYFINDNGILQCLRSLIDEYIDKQCSDKWCEIAKIGSMLDVAHREAKDGLFSVAQEIMDSLVGKCSGC